jgi:hypothetical protein
MAASGSHTTSAPSDHGWAALLSSELGSRGRPAGDGWKTAGELAPVLGVKIHTARERLNAMVSEGKLERVEGTNDRGVVCFFYRPRSGA